MPVYVCNGLQYSYIFETMNVNILEHPLRINYQLYRIRWPRLGVLLQMFDHLDVNHNGMVDYVSWTKQVQANTISLSLAMPVQDTCTTRCCSCLLGVC